MTNAMHVPEEDLALYAMQTLDADERFRIRTHIEECESCRELLAEVSADLGLLALSVEQHEVPIEARARFLESIGASPSAASQVISFAERAPTAQRPASLRTAPAHNGALWVSWAAIAALILVSVTLGLKLHSVTQEFDRQSALLSAQSAASERAKRVLDLLTTPDAHHVLLTAAASHPSPSARAVYKDSGGALILEASNLAPVAADRTYELWIIPADGKAPIPAGLFRPDARGNAQLVLPQIPTGVKAKALGVTVESASGSATPTLPIVLAGLLPTETE